MNERMYGKSHETEAAGAASVAVLHDDRLCPKVSVTKTYEEGIRTSVICPN